MSLQTQLAGLITEIGTEFKSVRALIGSLSSLATTDKSSVIAAINEVNSKPSGSGGASIADGDPGTATTTTYSANKITALNTAQNSVIAGKATIDDVTPTGTSAYSANKVISLNGAQDTVIAGKVDLASAQTISGVKTFSAPPVVPTNAFPQTAVSGLTASLAAKASVLDTAPITDTVNTWSAKKTNDVVEALGTKLTGGALAAFDTFAELQALMQADDTETAGIVTSLGLRLRVDGATQTISSANQDIARQNINAASATGVGNTETDLVALFTVAKS